MVIARKSTARTVTVGPVLDADGVAVTDAVVGDFKIAKNGGAPAALNGSATLTHRNTGHYSLALTASDLDTVGQAEVVIDDTVNACPIKAITVMEEAAYDAFFAASALGYVANAPVNVAQFGGVNLTATGGRPEVNTTHWGGTAVASARPLVDVAQISGDSAAADNLEAAADGTGYNLGGGSIVAASVTGAVGSVTGNVGGNVTGSVGSVTGAVGSVTGNVGGNVVGSVGSVATGGITAASLAADAITGDKIAAGAIAKGDQLTGLNDLSAAQVNTEVDTALTDIHLDHLLATTYDPASKPGAADALLNELVENDGGIARFTANALEQAPSGGGGTDWTADERTVIRAVLGIPGSGTTPDDPTTGILSTIDTVVDRIEVDTQDLQTQIGVDGAGLTAIGDTRMANLDATVSSRSTLTQAQVATEISDALTVDVVADSIPADGSRPTIAQAAYMLTQFMVERSVSGTTVTVRKPDGSTSLFTLTLNDAGTPTSITRSS